MATPETGSMAAFDLDDLLADAAASEGRYDEFLRRDSLSAGLYRLPAGATDRQEPHAEDEVYVVLEGRATLEVEGEATSVEEGSVVFVERGADHRFVDIQSALTTLVLFAPGEGTSEG